MGWVFDHSPTKGAERLVLLSIANHAGGSPADGAWEAWPGNATMQREANLDSERTVVNVNSRLVAMGATERIINGAPDMRLRPDRRPNLYRILLDHGVTCGDTRCRWCGVSPETERGVVPQQNGVSSGDATGCRPATGKPSVNRTDEPSVEPLLRVQEDLSTLSARTFLAFYAAYPRREGKAAALKAWPVAVKAAGGHQPIIDGAKRYAADPNRDPTYTKTPGPWLRGGHWEDEPLPARRNGHKPVDIAAWAASEGLGPDDEIGGIPL